MSEISVFDERLAEIDRRLRTIQSDLAPLPDPPPGSPPPPAADPAPPARLHAAPDPATPDPAATLIAELRELQAANERLLELQRELLSQYAVLLQRFADDRVATDVRLSSR